LSLLRLVARRDDEASVPTVLATTVRSLTIGDAETSRECLMAGTEGFDIVVVGGGAAGCVVAAGLAESPSRSVLLLEAGPDLRANVPEEFRDSWRLTQGFDWGYASEPDVRGLVDDLRRGKLLGEPRG
jgi:choline dehydrogenase-like flavoprotein